MENLRSARCSQDKFNHCSCSQNKTQCSHARKCSKTIRYPFSGLQRFWAVHDFVKRQGFENFTSQHYQQMIMSWRLYAISHTCNPLLTITFLLMSRSTRASRKVHQTLVDSSVWENPKLTIRTEVAGYNACIISALLYDREILTTYAKREQKLNSMNHFRCLRDILGITWRILRSSAVLIFPQCGATPTSM